MSTPAKQARALVEAEAFLRELADSSRIAPSQRYERAIMQPVSRRARRILRHYPGPAALRTFVLSWGHERREFLDVLDAECDRRREALDRAAKPAKRRRK